MDDLKRRALPAVSDDFGIIHIGIFRGMGLAICGEIGEPSYYLGQYDLASPDFCVYCAERKSSMN